MVYELDYKIGSGATSVVYAARDTETNKKVAIKQYNELDNNTLREICLLKSLKNMCGEDILCFMDFEKSKDHWWLITEFVDNPSLVEFLETKLKQKDKLTLMVNITKAIQRLHSVNIIHKDIKQENILVDSKTLKIKLIDFGYSCILNEEICKKAMGTIEYIDPKLLFSHRSGKYNDIYSLGVLFTEIWTNHFIVAKDDIQKVRKRDAVLQLNREINKIKDNKIKTLIQNMTQHDTSLRPDINQVLSELNNIQSQHDVVVME